MTEIFEAPADELGVPKPIIPSENFPNILPNSSEMSRHHELFLYGPRVFTTLGGKATRQSRVLMTETTIHNQLPTSFHRIYNQSSGPTSEQGQFNVMALSMAGYLPVEGVDLWSDEPVIRPMEDGEREILTTIDPNDESRYRNLLYSTDGEVPKFIEQFLKKQNPNLAHQDALDEFMRSSRIREVRESGYEILRCAIGQALQPLQESYQLARESGRLHPLAPAEPAGIIMDVLSSDYQKDRILYTFWRRLARTSLQTEVKVVPSLA